MTILIITLLIILYGYFSLAEIALISVTESELADEKYASNPRTAIVSGLIRDPEEFLSAVQVGMTLVGMLEGIYGGNLLAGILKTKLMSFGVSEVTATISAMTIGIGLITYITIVFGELVPKSIALQMPMKVSLAIAPSLRLFSKVTYPIIRLLTVSTRYILSFLRIKKSDQKKVSENDLRKMLSVAYQQGLFSKQQLWLHQNVLTFEDLTAKRIMKPARIVVSVPDHWERDQVKQFISKRQYSYFPVFKEHENNIVGVIRTKSFLLDDNSRWQKNIVHPCNLLDDTPAKDIFTLFKEKKLDFGLVYDNSNQYVGIVAMQDIMEGVFGDLPEIEDYSNYFYKVSDKKWMAEGFIHLQRIRIDLNLAWLRDYESKYLSISELIAGELEAGQPTRSIMINEVKFNLIPPSKDSSEKIEIVLP